MTDTPVPERAYLDYSMYVILDRALPHIGDGLKPVQRRIVYAMHDLGLRASAKYKKSARTVGDVIGKFHPHGDSAAYEAMVLMAQPFSYRYPLIDGQGNWGSSDDPKSFAAMRYTESRLTPFADLLLAEVGTGHGRLDSELRRYPRGARCAAGAGRTSCSTAPPASQSAWPPTSRRTTCARSRPACNCSTSRHHQRELCAWVRWPGFSHRGRNHHARAPICARLYERARHVRARAVWTREQGDIVITGLATPGVGSARAGADRRADAGEEAARGRRLRDESDHENPDAAGDRDAFEPRRGRGLMSHLFATTDLERSYRVNMNVIGLDGRPGVRDLASMLREWLDFRRQTVRRRLQHRLEQVLRRLHILDGLLIAFLNIDEVIAIIRSEDRPKPVLMARFGLSDEQAEAILELKLRHLAKLEEMKIRGEQANSPPSATL
jgi:topoisomerase-4 subunit A